MAIDRRRFSAALLVAGGAGIVQAKPRVGQAVAEPGIAGTQADAPPHPLPLHLPSEPTSVGPGSSWYRGAFALSPGSFYDNDGHDFVASYARKPKLPAKPRLGVYMHPSGGGPAVGNPYGAGGGVDIECRTQDGQVKGPGKAEMWCYGADGQPYPQRRIAAMIEALVGLYPQIDIDDKGIVCIGNSMGTGGINSSMLLPDPWRSRIAYCRGAIGVFMHRRIAARNPKQYRWPPDTPANKAMWDAVDFELLATKDRIVRNMHYRHAFSSDDLFSRGVGENGAPYSSTQCIWVNICETHKISAAAVWVKASHSHNESGINFPVITLFEDSAQDVTLDRAHPCFTSSTGNYPFKQVDRADPFNYPRGHYNLGLTWDHANIVDTADEIVFPIKYTARGNFGGGIPDQPSRITVDVTPRRPRHFVVRTGERIQWAWDGGAANGTVTVIGDVFTAIGVPMVSGAGYRRLQFVKRPA